MKMMTLSGKIVDVSISLTDNFEFLDCDWILSLECFRPCLPKNSRFIHSSVDRDVVSKTSPQNEHTHRSLFTLDIHPRVSMIILVPVSQVVPITKRLHNFNWCVQDTGWHNLF